MTFKTPVWGALIAFAVMAAVHLLLKVSEVSLHHGGLSAALQIGLLILSCTLYAGVHLLKHRIGRRDTLEIGRRGFQVTQPGVVPFALAWRMIREADLEQGPPAQWRFRLKNGGEALLREASFTREQWKKISVQLQRKLHARKIPVRVVTGGPAPSP